MKAPLRRTSPTMTSKTIPAIAPAPIAESNNPSPCASVPRTSRAKIVMSAWLWPNTESEASIARMRGAENERRDDGRALRDQEKPPALDAIGHGPANESEREDGRGAKQAAKAEKERRIGQLVEQPRRRGELDPGARHRDQLPDPIQRVVPMTERSEPREKCRHAIIADGTGECACA